MSASVSQLWRYPVKSFQGFRVDELTIDSTGVVGDRRFALIDDRGKLMSAKRYSTLLGASARENGDGVTIELPDGRVLPADPAAGDTLSEWLGVACKLEERAPDVAVGFEMTFDPPNDDADYYEIPAPPGSFQDMADVHIVTAATLAHCASVRPDLDWDVRRFRPNVVVDGHIEPFGEDAWVGREVQLGDVVVRIDQQTVRCAMPLRGQPGLERQASMFAAMDELHANHFGLYATVVVPGLIRAGDTVTVL